MGVGTDDASALATLSMLEERLHRLEYLLHGISNAFGVPDPASPPAKDNEAVSTRLANLQGNLHRLASRHGVVQDVLDLCMKPALPTSGSLLIREKLPTIQICLFQLPQINLQPL
jgi:hypothetical protein